MSSPDPAFIGTPVAGAVGAIFTIVQAVPAIDKRLARVVEVESQIGRLPALVRRLYVQVQKFYKWALILITVVGVVMVIAYIFTGTFTGGVFVFLREQGITLIVLWLVLGVTMYTNILSRLAMWVWYGLTWLVPFRSALKVWRLDHHPDWQALRSFVELNEGAKPLVVSRSAAVTFVDALHRMLNASVTVRNRALPPQRPEDLDVDVYQQRLGNALLTACVTEEAHYEPGSAFPSRDWGPFYGAFGDLVIETDLFAIATVRSRHLSDDYYDEIFRELNKRLLLRGQAEMIGSLELKERRWKATFTTLVDEYKGDVGNIDPGADSIIRSRMDIIYKRIGRLPALKDEGMRAQFLKLAAVWEVWRDIPRVDFRFPFAKRVAALLMDRGVILAPDDVKVLAFERPEEREVQRAAMKVIVDHFYGLVANRRANEKWLPKASQGADDEEFRWWLTFELDFRIWDYAKHLHNGEDIPPGDGLTKWKYADGRVARVAMP